MNMNRFAKGAKGTNLAFADFFQMKAEATPKGPNTLIINISLFLYTLFVSSFICLLIYELNYNVTTTYETSIESTTVEGKVCTALGTMKQLPTNVQIPQVPVISMFALGATGGDDDDDDYGGDDDYAKALSVGFISVAGDPFLNSFDIESAKLFYQSKAQLSPSKTKEFCAALSEIVTQNCDITNSVLEFRVGGIHNSTQCGGRMTDQERVQSYIDTDGLDCEPVVYNEFDERVDGTFSKACGVQGFFNFTPSVRTEGVEGAESEFKSRFMNCFNEDSDCTQEEVDAENANFAGFILSTGINFAGRDPLFGLRSGLYIELSYATSYYVVEELVADASGIPYYLKRYVRFEEACNHVLLEIAAESREAVSPYNCKLKVEKLPNLTEGLAVAFANVQLLAGLTIPAVAWFLTRGYDTRKLNDGGDVWSVKKSRSSVSTALKSMSSVSPSSKSMSTVSPASAMEEVV